MKNGRARKHVRFLCSQPVPRAASHRSAKSRKAWPMRSWPAELGWVPSSHSRVSRCQWSRKAPGGPPAARSPPRPAAPPPGSTAPGGRRYCSRWHGRRMVRRRVGGDLRPFEITVVAAEVHHHAVAGKAPVQQAVQQPLPLDGGGAEVGVVAHRQVKVPLQVRDADLIACHIPFCLRVHLDPLQNGISQGHDPRQMLHHRAPLSHGTGDGHRPSPVSSYQVCSGLSSAFFARAARFFRSRFRTSAAAAMTRTASSTSHIQL